MAYWPAEVTGLGSCVEPLVDLVRVLAREGEPVARELYGCDGWVAHHNSDVWGWALPVGRGQGDPAWAAWWMGGVWLCRHLWDRYTFTLDPDVLRDVWPLLRGAGAFALDWLVPDGAGGLVPSPSSSPENERVVDGRLVALCAGSAADVALVRDLLRACVEAADVLALDEPLAPRWRHALGRLRGRRSAPTGCCASGPTTPPPATRTTVTSPTSSGCTRSASSSRTPQRRRSAPRPARPHPAPDVTSPRRRARA